MQFLAALERFWSWAEESRMAWTIVWAVFRFWEEICIAAKIISVGFGGFGSWVWERVVWQTSGNRVALHAWITSAGTEAESGFLPGFRFGLLGEWRESAGERAERKRKAERRERERIEAMEKKMKGLLQGEM